MLRFPRVLWAVLLLAVGLALPSLLADLYADDQAMVLSMEGVARSPIPGPFHLYTFMSGAPGERDAMVAASQIPWWTVDGIRLSFCRPLSSVLLRFDHAVAGRRPLFYHLHSMAWYAAAALSAALLFRRLLPEREAALAALLFAASPAHCLLAAWPSARHVAISGLFAIWALILYLEARERQRGALTAGALLCAVCALAGGETGLGVFAYVAAYQLVARDGPLSVRLRVLLPWGALFLAYATLYKALNYGVHGAGDYVDPIAAPASYLRVLPTRLAVYANAALLGVPSELSTLAPRAVPFLAGMGVFAALTFAGLFRRAARALAPEEVRTLSWLLLGGALAVLPGIASIPGDRVLFLPNLALAPALSVVLLHAGSKRKPVTALSVLSRAGVALFGVLHLLLGPLWFAFNARQLARTSHAALAAVSNAEIPARAGVYVVGIGLADPLIGMYLASALYIAPRPEPRPQAVHLLSMSAHDQRITRLDDRSLELTVLNGSLLEGAFEVVFRPPNAPLHTGDTIPLGRWRVHMLATTEGRPTRFSVLFDRSLDDPSIVLITWHNGALRQLPAPPVGESCIVKHEVGPMGL